MREERLKIACDLDDVIADLVPTLLLFLNNRYNLNIQFNDVKSWNMWEWAGLSMEQYQSTLREFERGKYRELPLVPGAKEGLEKISKNSNVYIVTFRKKDREEDTIFWLEKNQIPYSKLLFSDHQPKIRIYKDINPDFIIDDSPSVASYFSDFTGFFLYDKPWNKKIGIKEERRVKNWQEFLNKVFKLK